MLHKLSAAALSQHISDNNNWTILLTCTVKVQGPKIAYCHTHPLHVRYILDDSQTAKTKKRYVKHRLG